MWLAHPGRARATRDGHADAFIPRRTSQGHIHDIREAGRSRTPSRGAFVAPRANLYDDHGKLVITHFAGPRWQAKDASTVLGARVDGVTVDPTAIPWLLLSTTSVGEHGGRLAHTTFIQRIATAGGLAPAAGDCTAATAGAVREVPCTADYTFWKATGH